MTMREAFEDWWKQKGNGTYRRSDMFDRDEDRPDAYFYGDVQHGWQTYAAGAKSDTAILQSALQALEHARNWLDPDSCAGIEAEITCLELVEAIRNRGEN